MNTVLTPDQLRFASEVTLVNNPSPPPARAARGQVGIVPLAAERCDDVVLVGKLGRGGAAEVFLAVERTPNGPALCVVKRLHAYLEHESEELTAFLDEARLVAQLTHPNIVASREVRVRGTRAWLKLE